MIYLNDISHIAWRLHLLDLIFVFSTIVAVAYSLARYRQGQPKYLVLWLSCVAYGVVLEFTTGMMISRSYIQGDFTFMINTTAIGFTTDMPLYVLLLYPTIIFLGFVVIESFGIRSITARAVSAGVIMVLIDAPYVVNGPLADVGWWQWLDWRVGDRAIFEYWYGWPMADAYWEMTWPALLMWLVWRWEQRWSKKRSGPHPRPDSRSRMLIGVPLAIGVLVNLGGFVVAAPLSIFIGFGWPHFIIVVITLMIQATVLLFADKSPVGMNRGGVAVLGVHLVGYGIVTVANLWSDPVPAGQITIVTVASTALVVLCVYTSQRARTRVPRAPDTSNTALPDRGHSPETVVTSG